MPAQSLLLDHISQRYGAATVVDDVTLDIRPGELVALLGPSGYGKATLLKAIGGFVRQSAGRAVIGGQAVDALPPNRRRIGIVFQNYALFPHMTVAQNVAYGLDVQGLPGRDKGAKVRVALASPPIDVMLHDPGPALQAIAAGMVQPYPVAQSQYYKDLIPVAQEPIGPAGFFQVVGLTYNPETVKTPPTSWADLWKPEYKGRVGITNLNSTLGTGFMVEIAKMHGGSERNIEPAFQRLKALKPNLAAVAANPGALATLFQQGQVDLSPGNFNAIQILKAQGVPVEFVAPKEGAIAFKTTFHITKNSPNPDLAFKLIEAALSPEVRGKLMADPYLVVPTNARVQMQGEVAKTLAKTHDEMAKQFVFQDWAAINESRAAWIDRFNREIAA